MTLSSHVDEFRKIVDSIYGVHLDASEGFALVRKLADELDQDSPGPPGRSSLSYSRLVRAGSEPRNRHIHQVPIDDLRRRNEEGGPNLRRIGDVCVVTLFQFWEDHFREVFAKDLGLPKKELKVPVFGDLRHYRNSIVHNLGRATTDVEKCCVLRWFRRGQEISLTRYMVEEMVDRVLEVLKDIEENPERYVNPA